MNDGSADFAGNIRTGNYNASSSSGQGVIVYASGALNIQKLLALLSMIVSKFAVEMCKSLE